MRDIITLRGLRAFGIHGVYDFEQTQSQPFVVDIALWVDISPAISSDSIEHTVSYADVARDVVSIITGPSVKLIETLAERIATALMAYPLVDGVQVVVHKPQAPLEQEFSDVSVSVTRGLTRSSGNERVIALEEPSTGEEKTAPTAPGDDEVPEAVITPVFPFPSRRDYAASRKASPAFTLPRSAPTPMETAPPAEAPALPEASALPVPPTLAEPPASSAVADLPAPATAESPHTADSSAQTDEPSWREFVLAFGGNQGNVPVTLAAALDLLEKVPGVEIHTVSPLLRTHAVLKPGMDPQDDHWNMVALGRTSYEPHELLRITADLEGVLGRLRPFEWAPRTIDIDLITVGDAVINDEVLKLPHPRAHMRGFVLIPWLLVDPRAELPGFGSVAELAAQASDRDGIVDIVEQWRHDPEHVIADSNLFLASEIPPPATPAPATPAPATPTTDTPVASASISADETFPDETFPDETGPSLAQTDEQPPINEHTPQEAADEAQESAGEITEPLEETQVFVEVTDEAGQRQDVHLPPVSPVAPPTPKTPRPRERNFAAEWEKFVKQVELAPLTVSQEEDSQEEEPSAITLDESALPETSPDDAPTAEAIFTEELSTDEHTHGDLKVADVTTSDPTTGALPTAALLTGDLTNADLTPAATPHDDIADDTAPEGVVRVALNPSSHVGRDDADKHAEPGSLDAGDTPADAQDTQQTLDTPQATPWTPSAALSPEEKPAPASLADAAPDSAPITTVAAFLSTPADGLKVLKSVDTDRDKTTEDPGDDAPTVYQPIPTPAAEDSSPRIREIPTRRRLRHSQHSTPTTVSSDAPTVSGTSPTEGDTQPSATPGGKEGWEDVVTSATSQDSAEQRFAKPSFDEALVRERRADTPVAVSWIPVGAQISQSSMRGALALEDTQEATDTPHIEARPLPKWNFSTAPVNVIDSIDEADMPDSTTPDSTLHVENPPSGQILLDPDLPEDIEVGILPPSGEMPTILTRRNVLRPTHTGATPVVKPQE